MNYEKTAEKSTVEAVAAALAERGFEPIVVGSGAAALEKVKELIPAGASVMNGSSRTLEEIGFVEYLKSGEHGWNNLHAAIVAETDPARQGQLRREATLSNYYVGSVHAVTEQGELFVVSNTGSQLPHLAFTSSNLVLVAGTHKIVPDLASAFRRLEEHIVPLEDENMKQKYGMGTLHAKTLVLHRESPMMGRKVRVILANEKLGF
jgi:hypothetical protein